MDSEIKDHATYYPNAPCAVFSALFDYSSKVDNLNTFRIYRAHNGLPTTRAFSRLLDLEYVSS